MEYKILVPEMGESIVEATIARWLKKTGENVAAGDAVVELETDKVTLEVPAEEAGILSRIDYHEGDDVRIGDTIGVISSITAPPEKAQSATHMQKSSDLEGGSKPADIVEEKTVNFIENVTPLARKIATDQGVDLSHIQGTGTHGRVIKQDIENYVTNIGNMPETKPGILTLQQPAQVSGSGNRHEERVRASRRRRTIAKRMVEAQQAAAMLTTFNDVDMTAVMEIRQKRKQAFKDRFGVSLGIVSFFVKASILALKEFPQINAELQGDEVVFKHYYDIGIAVGSEEGLVVPVLRNADQMTFAEIEQVIHDLSQRTQEGKLTLEDLRGGTFTITNGGVFGSLLSTPILNTPQVAILGLHRIEERPVVVDHQVVIRQMMYMAVTYDHRLVDGRDVVLFLGRIKDAIEHPEIMLLEL